MQIGKNFTAIILVGGRGSRFSKINEPDPWLNVCDAASGPPSEFPDNVNCRGLPEVGIEIADEVMFPLWVIVSLWGSPSVIVPCFTV